MPLAAPESPDALASELARASARKQPVEIGGAFTKTRWGGPRPVDALSVSTREMRRILAYEPRDLTVSVEAGLPWRELTETLAANRQMIPLDPPSRTAPPWAA
jgi:glycolate oxidase FAD binding subunit